MSNQNTINAPQPSETTHVCTPIRRRCFVCGTQQLDTDTTCNTCNQNGVMAPSKKRKCDK